METFTTRYKVTIAGHSYVKWLEHFIINDEVDLMGKIDTCFGLYKEDIDVEFFAKPGAQLFQLKCETHLLLKDLPDIMILIIGGNDMDGGGANPVELAAQVFRYGEYIIGKGVKFLAFMQVIQRLNRNNDFKEYAEQYNERLKSLCKEHPKLRFWNLHRINVKDLRRDGVHLNNRGNYFLYNGIKSCIRHAISHIEEGTPCIHEVESIKLRGGKRYRVR